MALDTRRRAKRPARLPGHRPWERQPSESAQEFAHFSCYLALGPDRSLAQAGEQCGLSLSRLKQLSARWNWLFRALAWDQEQFLRRRRGELEACRETRERLLKESADLQRIAGMEFRSWVSQDENGQLQLVRELTPPQAVRLWQVGCEALRELQGDPAGSVYERALPPDSVLADRIETGIRQAARAAVIHICHHADAEVDQALRTVIVAWVSYYFARHPDPESVHIDALWPWDMPYAEA